MLKRETAQKAWIALLRATGLCTVQHSTVIDAAGCYSEYIDLRTPGGVIL